MEDWLIILNQATNLLDINEDKFESLGGNVQYRLHYVDADQIVVDRVNGGNYAKIGRHGAINAINRLKERGRIYKSDFINSVIRQATIVMLHPNIFYDSDTKEIIWREPVNGIELIERVIDEAEDDELEKIQIQINKRRNQSKFRYNILNLYNSKCAISKINIPEVLDAAHIISHSETGINKQNNGILLRNDLHVLFDKNLILINPYTKEVLIDEALRDSQYNIYHKSKIELPITNEYLLKKWENINISTKESFR